MEWGHIFRKGRGFLFLSLLFLFLGSLCLFPSLVFGGDNTWTSNGPSGAKILSLAIDASNNIVYAGSEDVYKTTDGGSNWQSTGLLKNVSVQSLLIDPSNADNIYAGTSGGVYKSTDKGGSWTTGGLPTSISVYALVYDESTTPDTIYAGTDQGVYKSTDGGSSWSFLSALPSIQVNALTLDPNTSNPKTIYAATSTQGIYKSSNGGTSWTAISSGLPSNTSILSLAIDPTTSSIVYAGTSGKGVYKSSDSGSSWSASNTDLASNATIYSLAIDTDTTSIIYAGTSGAGIYKSTNSGGSWTAFNTGLPSSTTSIRVLAINTSTTSTLYSGTDGSGVYKSTDSGANWAATNDGIPTQSNISTLVIDPTTTQNLYAAGSMSVGTGSGASTIKAVFKSTDSGSSWSTITNGITTYSILILAIDSNTPSTLYAGTLNGGIYKSTDSGSNWSALTSGIFSNTTIYSLAIHPTDSNTIYAGGYYVLESVNIGTIYKSTDGGTTWSSSSTGIPQAGLVYALAIDPNDPDNTLYAGTASGVYKSTDGGSTWTASNSGIDSGDYIYSLAVDPNNSTIIYAGTGNSTKSGSGEVMKSTNSGTTWVATGSEINNTVVNALTIDPNTSSTIYAGTLTGGFYMSQNSGDSWLDVNPGLGSAGSVNAVVIDPSDTTIIHIGTQTGVYGFDFENRSPNTPSSPSPAHGSTVTSALTQLSWSGDDPDPDPWDTVTYDVYWDGAGGNDNPPLWATNQTKTTIDVSPLQNPSTDYYWKVVAKDNHGATTTSSIWKFTTAATLTNNAPNTPSAPNPSNGATDQATDNLILSWTGGDPDNDTVTYTIYFGQDSNPPEVTTTTNTNYTPGTLNPSTTYYWYIVADDGRSSTTTGPTWSFTTGSSLNNAPNTPSNPSPADGATNQSINTTLSWTGSDPDSDTVTYDLYFGTDSSNLTIKASGFNTTSYDPGALKYDTTYYWQVKATDSRGATSLSAVWSFSTSTTSGANNAPTASAGQDQTVTTGSAITLDGSSSSDPDGDSLTYNWSLLTQPQDSNASVFDSTSAKATLIPDVDGTYRIQLEVSDGSALSTDIIRIVSLGKDYNILIDTEKEEYISGDTVNLYVWVGNPASNSEIKADAFIGLVLPDGSFLFFDPALNLKSSDSNDSRTYTPFAENATLSPGLVFPTTQEMSTDIDGNGKLDSFKLYSLALNPLVLKGQYLGFAALTQPGSVQSGNPQLIGNISLTLFNFNP